MKRNFQKITKDSWRIHEYQHELETEFISNNRDSFKNYSKLNNFAKTMN